MKIRPAASDGDGGMQTVDKRSATPLPDSRRGRREEAGSWGREGDSPDFGAGGRGIRIRWKKAVPRREAQSMGKFGRLWYDDL